MKKLLLIFVLIFSLSMMFSCGDSEGGGSTEGETPATVKYTVIWKDETGVQLDSAEVAEGVVPSYSYSKADTAEWDYTVLGWSATQGGEVLAAIPAASADATYYAVVSQVKRQYTVTFDTLGGSDIAAVTVDYGTVIDVPAETPTLDAHKFMGWSAKADEYVAFDFTAPVVANVTAYAVWNEVVDIKALLAELTSGYELSPYGYIPETMLSSYADNLINPDDVISDYSSNVAVSDILYGGFGEQWNMVITNLNQSQVFFNVLSSIENVIATSLATFNNYLDQNPDDTAQHNIASGIYSITLNFDGDIIYFVIDYTATIPALGEQSVQIALSMDAETKEKTVRVQLGDPNALTYKITEDGYEFAVKYLGVRRAHFSVSRNEDGDVVGQIYETLGAFGAGTSSAANFYVIGDYVYAVGNKADGLIGFTGYICEVYDKNNGKLVGYEVLETVSLPVVGEIDLNTLWFNIADVDGINSIRYVEKTETTDAAFYINGASTAWDVVKVGVFEDPKRMNSRKFDIEFRTQYFYYYDQSSGKHEQIAVKVPMFFVQEEDFEDVIALVEDKNKIDITFKTVGEDLDAVMIAYDSMIPAFIEVKELITEEVIVAYIGEKITFVSEE